MPYASCLMPHAHKQLDWQVEDAVDQVIKSLLLLEGLAV